jgi:peptidoglycan/LPS O-acetylase OafA/YrhL
VTERITGVSSTRLTYRPELDGLRAAAVVAVVLFHAEVPGFTGGYLGVSLFFTLSGYLITGLLLAEHGQNGRIDLAAFYARRAKRLLPASALCLLAIAVASWTTDWFDAVADLRRDLVGAALQVSNWVFLAGEGSYQALFADAAGQPSPVEHFWSLAIEEQFYWLWPLVFVALSRRATDPGRRLRFVVWATVATGLSAPAIAAVWGGDAVYWATPARASEILVGAVVAFIGHPRRATEAVQRRLWRWVAPAGLAMLALAVVLFPSSGGPAFAGFLPLVGLLSAAVLFALERSAGSPTHRLLSLRPLVGLGRISYGVYLFHWPVFVVIDRRRFDLDDAPLLAVRLLVSVGLALVSYYALERPIRTLELGRPRLVATWSLGGTAAVVLVSIALVPAAVGDYWSSKAVDEAVSAARIDPPGTAELIPLVPSSAPTTPPGTTTTRPGMPTTAPGTSITSPETTAAPLPRLERPVRIVVGGDSTAEALGAGLALWAGERPDLAQVSLLATVGCGFLRGGDLFVGDWRPVAPTCDEWFGSRFIAEVEAVRPDVVMLHSTSWDVLDHRWEDGTVRNPFDPEFVGRLSADYATLTERLLEAGVTRVVWVRQPVPNPFWLGERQDQEDPSRHQVVYDVVDDIAAARPLSVRVVDLPAWLASEDLVDDRDSRPDGVHWSPTAALDITRRFLGEQLVRAALGIE